MKNYNGPATLIHNGRESTVECAFRVTLDRQSELVEWSGEYSGATVATEPEPGETILRLPNGSEATVIINHTSLGGSGSFVGSGNPPAA